MFVTIRNQHLSAKIVKRQQMEVMEISTQMLNTNNTSDLYWIQWIFMLAEFWKIEKFKD